MLTSQVPSRSLAPVVLYPSRVASWAPRKPSPIQPPFLSSARRLSILASFYIPTIFQVPTRKTFSIISWTSFRKMKRKKVLASWAKVNDDLGCDDVNFPQGRWFRRALVWGIWEFPGGGRPSTRVRAGDDVRRVVCLWSNFLVSSFMTWRIMEGGRSGALARIDPSYLHDRHFI